MMAENIKANKLAWPVRCKEIQKYCYKLSHGKMEKMTLSKEFGALSKTDSQETDV